MNKHEITRADIMDMTVYAAERKQRRTAITAMKKNRRLHCGPHATFYFENYDTMFHQVHEMLHIERGGEAQIVDEMAAYNPMIPKGGELTATVMFEIEDPIVRERFLDGLGGVENTMFIEFDGEVVNGVPEADIERTSADGKASSVQFMHFPFTPAQIAKFRTPGLRVMTGMTHEKYGHVAIMPEAVRDALSRDFD